MSTVTALRRTVPPAVTGELNAHIISHIYLVDMYTNDIKFFIEYDIYSKA